MGMKGKANLDTANTTAMVKFDEVFNTVAPGPWSLFTEVYSTGTERDELVFASFLNTIREWLGAREYGNFEAFRQAVVLTKWEDTFSLPRLLVEYDQSGAVGRALAQKITSSRTNSDDKLIFDALTSASGGGPTGFDGVSLINDSHTLGGSTYDNKTTSALTHATWDSAIQAMMGFKAANGEPLNMYPDTLVVGPKLKKTAFEIAQVRDRIVAVDNSGAESGTRVAASTIGNVFAGDNVNVVVWNRLTGTQDDYWYAMDLSKQDKPILLKNEREYELVTMTDPKDHDRFSKDNYVWGIEADKQTAAGAWPTIYGGIL